MLCFTVLYNHVTESCEGSVGSLRYTAIQSACTTSYSAGIQDSESNMAPRITMIIAVGVTLITAIDGEHNNAKMQLTIKKVVKSI